MVGRLGARFPDSAHVTAVGLERASDMRIWEFAKTNGFVVVSRDADFYERSLVEGAPPKIIWLNCGNNSTEFMTELLLE